MEKNKSEERKQIKEESKKKADCRSSVERIEAEKQKVVVPGTAAQKAEESRRKIESGSIQQLRVAESRQGKKAERRSKKQTVEDRVK